jgi:hypothetical protein
VERQLQPDEKQALHEIEEIFAALSLTLDMIHAPQLTVDGLRNMRRVVEKGHARAVMLKERLQ